jgi:pyruvate/2-oxoglutarate dehydrogenase complex dihydrolipoamide acyltransferase (E2) component
MTPIIPNVNLKVLAQILKEVKELAEKPKKKIETTRIPRRNIHHF